MVLLIREILSVGIGELRNGSVLLGALSHKCAATENVAVVLQAKLVDEAVSLGQQRRLVKSTQGVVGVVGSHTDRHTAFAELVVIVVEIGVGVDVFKMAGRSLVGRESGGVDALLVWVAGHD